MHLLALVLCCIALDQERMEWKVGDDTRESMVYTPAKSSDAPPLVFGFHGHGGSMRNAARSFRLHEEWPEAVVVYMQGLPTVGKTDPEGKKAGWQKTPGDYKDRDLLFFDAVLATMKEKFKVDALKIYATGHSNGGAFTYLLWGVRTTVFAAMAPSAAPGLRNLKEATPCPVLHLGSEKDEIVPFESQKATIDGVKKLNGCSVEGTEWAKGCTIFASTKNAPVVTFIHDGGHAYPKEAPALIVKFFKEHARPQ